MGHNYEACDLRGKCSCQNIVESDGSVYTCDFYVKDEYSIGNLLYENFEEMYKNKVLSTFINKSLETSDKCLNCKYFALCRNGCRRYRDENNNLNNYCESYYNFFEYSIDRFRLLAHRIKK